MCDCAVTIVLCDGLLSCLFSQYLGSTAAQKTHGPGSTEEPVKKIVTDVSERY